MCTFFLNNLTIVYYVTKVVITSLFMTVLCSINFIRKFPNHPSSACRAFHVVIRWLPPGLHSSGVPLQSSAHSGIPQGYASYGYGSDLLPVSEIPASYPSISGRTSNAGSGHGHADRPDGYHTAPPPEASPLNCGCVPHRDLNIQFPVVPDFLVCSMVTSFIFKL